MLEEQIQPVNLDFEYKIGVKPQSKKSYKYTLYDETEELDWFSSEKQPSELNKNSQHVSGFIKILDGKNLQVDTAKGSKISITKDMITKDVMVCLSNLQDDLDSAKINEEKRRDEQHNKELSETIELSAEKSEEFVNLLYESDVTLFTFLWVCATWMNGGETKNTLIGVICHASTYLGINPVWFIPVGKSGEGKSMIDKSARKFLPKEAFRNGRVSESALHRRSVKEGENYLDCKIMLMGDMGGTSDLEKWKDTIDRYKELSTDGEAELEKTGEGIDPDTGERRVIPFKLTGHPSVAMTSVNSESFDEQILSRSITVTPEASNEQVSLFAKYNEGVIAEERTMVEQVFIKMFHYLLVHIKHEYGGVGIINPYWDCLNEWFKDTDNYKRNLDIYPALVKTMTLINIEFREKITSSDGKVYAVSTREDNDVIARLVNPGNGLSASAIKLFNKLTNWYKSESVDDYQEMVRDEYNAYISDFKNNFDNQDFKHIFSVSEVKQKAGKTKTVNGLQYGAIINHLVDKGLVQVLGKLNRSSNNVYALLRTSPITQKPIQFDDATVKKYIDEMSVIYRVSSEELLEIVNQDFGVEDSEGFIPNLRVPPWESKLPMNYREPPTTTEKPTKNQSETTENHRKTSEVK